MARPKKKRYEFVPSLNLYRYRPSWYGKAIYAKTEEEMADKVEFLKRNTEQQKLSALNPTFGQAAKEWYEIKATTVSPTTLWNIQKHITYLNHTLKDIPIRHINTTLYTNALSYNPSLSPQSKKMYQATLRGILSFCKERRIINDLPFAEALPFKTLPKPKKALSQDQTDYVLKQSAHRQYEAFAYLAVYTGMRASEILGLLWENVHLKSETPYISVKTHIVESYGHVPHFSDKLKTPAAYRDIPICIPLFKYLSALPRTSEFVCIRNIASALNVSDAFRHAFDSPITPHALRRTWITRLIASGVDPKTVQYLAGHEKSDITMNIYAQVMYNQPKDTYAMINSAML